MSEVILGVWNGYTELWMLLARPTPVVAAVEVEDGYSGGRKARSHAPAASARTFLLFTSLINLSIADGERDSSERREVVGTLSAASQASVKPSNGVGRALMPGAV